MAVFHSSYKARVYFANKVTDTKFDRIQKVSLTHTDSYHQPQIYLGVWGVESLHNTLFEINGFGLKQAEWLIMIIHQLYCSIVSVQLLLSNNSHFWHHYVVLWPTDLSLTHNWSCCLDRLVILYFLFVRPFVGPFPVLGLSKICPHLSFLSFCCLCEIFVTSLLCPRLVLRSQHIPHVVLAKTFFKQKASAKTYKGIPKG